MMFKPELCKKILNGEKTMTRRPIDGPCAFVVGQQFAVQPGMARPRIATAEIVAVGRERVDDITNTAARAEGFDSRWEFFDYWRKLYGRNADMARGVWVIEFKLVAVTHGICGCCDGTGTEPTILHGVYGGVNYGVGF